jgi:hypothetical protein
VNVLPVLTESPSLYDGNCGAYDVAPESLPVTLHIVFPAGDSSQLVWIADKLAIMGRGNLSSVEKILYLRDYKTACSMWGDFESLRTRDAFAARVRSGAISVEGDKDTMVRRLSDLAAEFTPPKNAASGPEPNRLSRGIIVATFGSPVRVYQVLLTNPTVVLPIAGALIAGDLDNPANLFATHYYELCGKSIRELLALGVHTMLLARKLNSRGVGGPDAWVFEKDQFRQLDPNELLGYVNRSNRLDASILRNLNRS